MRLSPARFDFWLVLFFKAAELSLLLLFLQSLPPQPPSSCWCSFSTAGSQAICEVQPRSSKVSVFCPFVFHRVLSQLLFFSSVACLVQTLLCLLLPIHSLHFLGLSFFQLTIGISTPLLLCHWQWEAEEFPPYEGPIPQLTTPAVWQLLFLQAAFFLFSFHRSYHHVWSKYKLLTD